MPHTPKEQALRIALTQSLKKNEVYRKALAEIAFKTTDPIIRNIAFEALKEK